MNQSSLKKELIEQQEYYFNPNVSLTDYKYFGKMDLLPIYDEFIMGYKDRSAIMTLKKNASLRYDCMIVFDGQVIGTWKRSVSKNAIDVEYDLFKPLNKFQSKAFDEAIHRFSEFSNMKVRVQ